MPQPYNYVPRGGFGHAKSTVEASEGLAASLSAFGKEKQYQDVKKELGEIGVTGYAGPLAPQEKIGMGQPPNLDQVQGASPDETMMKYQNLLNSNPEMANLIQPQMQAYQQQRQQEKNLALRKQFDVDMSSLVGSSDGDKIESLYSKYPMLTKGIDAKVKRLDIRSEKQAKKNFGVLDFMLSQGNKDGAAQYSKDISEAYKESNPSAAEEWMTIADAINDDSTSPERDRVDIDLLAGRSLGKEWFAEKKTQEESRNLSAKTASQVASTKAGAEANNQAKALLTTTKTKNEITKQRVEIKRLEKDFEREESGKVTRSQIEPTEARLRSEYTRRAEPHLKRKVAYDTLRTTEKTGQGDLAIVFAYMNLLDPGVAVMEGDVRNAQSATGKLARMMGLSNEFMTGQKFKDDAERQKFIDQGKTMYENSEKVLTAIKAGYTSTAKTLGVRPENIMFNEEAVDVVPVEESDFSGEQSGALPSFGNNAIPSGAISSPFSIKAPNGKTYPFKSQKDLDSFKKKANIK